MFKFIKILSVIIYVIVLMSGCVKNNESTTCEGYIKNYYNNKPIDSAMVVLTEFFYAGTPPADFKYPKKAISYTDKNGYFKVTLEDSEELPSFSVKKVGFSFDPDWEDGVAEGVTAGLGYGYHRDLVYYLKPDTSFRATIFNKGAKVDSIIISFFEFKSPEWSVDADDNIYIYGDNVKNNKLYFSGAGPWNICENNFVYFRTTDDFLRYKIDYKRQDAWYSTLDSVNLDSLNNGWSMEQEAIIEFK